MTLPAVTEQILAESFMSGPALGLGNSVTAYTCRTCGCLVPRGCIRLHVRYHADMKEKMEAAG